MTKITPGWDKGKGARPVESARPVGKPNPPIPHFKPVKAPGKPAAPSLDR